jgi:ferredoxin-thioredoxin reductase catalytic subunit
MADSAGILASMKKNAEENGYFICPDKELLSDLIRGLATIEERFGYGPCPCRISSGIRQYDVDIICPCEYRDADVNEFGMCYCGLFVSQEINDDPSKMSPVPERRPVEAQDAAMEAKDKKEKGEDQETPHEHVQAGTDSKGLPIWRCVVCGYLCARELPPPICPICKAKADRFEPFSLG